MKKELQIIIQNQIAIYAKLLESTEKHPSAFVKWPQRAEKELAMIRTQLSQQHPDNSDMQDS